MTDVGNISSYEPSGPVEGGTVPRAKTPYELKYNAKERIDELAMFSIFGANGEAFYNYLHEKMVVHGKPLVSFLSYGGPGSYTNMEMLLEIMYLLKKYTNADSDEENHSRGIQTLEVIKDLYEQGKVLPWDNGTDEPLQRLKTREYNKNIEMEKAGRDTEIACGKNGCQETYVTTAPEQHARGEEGMTHVTRCIECSNQRK